MGELRVVLFAGDMTYPTLRSDFGPRVQAFQAQDECIRYIRHQMPHCTQIDLFLSSDDQTIIGDDLPLFSNVIFHLYCPTADDIAGLRTAFPQQAYVKILEEAYLWVEIGYIFLGHDNTRLMQSNNSAEARARWERTHEILLQEVEAAKTGIEPE